MKTYLFKGEFKMVYDKEIDEAVKAMLLLSKQVTNDSSIKERDIYAILRGLNYSQQWEYIVRDTEFDIEESGAILIFRYSLIDKKWRVSLKQGTARMNSMQLICKDKSEKIVDEGSFFDFGDFSFKLHYYQNKTKKNQKSYQKLIIEAINSAPENKMTLSQIYLYFINKVGFSESDSSTWKNSIRHNLSLNKIFKKIPRTSSETQGKGMFWTVDYSKVNNESKIKKENKTLDCNVEKDDNLFQVLETEKSTYRKRMLSLSKNDFSYFKYKKNNSIDNQFKSKNTIDFSNEYKNINQEAYKKTIFKNKPFSHTKNIENLNLKSKMEIPQRKRAIIPCNRNLDSSELNIQNKLEVNPVKRKIEDFSPQKRFKSDYSSGKKEEFLLYNDTKIETNDDSSSDEEMLICLQDKKDIDKYPESRTRSSSLIDLPDEFLSMSLYEKRNNKK